ncbi:MAG: hypothetical protein ACJ780_09930 [Solirubrobacteraceae bacterium]|jgi:hypothetical protein
MSQVVFTNPRTSATYTWPINPGYDGMTQAAQKQRQIARTSNTANVGATKQQGEDGPIILHWEPLIFHAAHEQALWEWYVLCKLQTIYLTDWNGEKSEGQIITLGRQWLGAIAGPGDTTERRGYAKYVFEFEVYRLISGVMAAAGVQA